MSIRFRAALIAVLLLALTVATFAQPGMRQQRRELGLPRFDVNAISLLSDEAGKTQVIAYIEIPFENLQFVRSTRGYEANYEVDLSVLAGPDKSSPRIANELWRSTVIVSSFDLTNSRERFDISETTLELTPGSYTLVAKVTDLETRKQADVTSNLTVPTYNTGALAMSDLLLARNVMKTATGAYEIVPNVDRVIAGSDEDLYVYYELYPNGSDTLDVYARVLDRRGEIVHEQRTEVEAEQPVTRDFIQIPAADLGVGRHVVELQVRSDKRSLLKAADFNIRLTGLPSSVKNMDQAIRQLRYIARPRLVDRMLTASAQDQQVLFRDFWQEQDPTPSTPENELMQEYYNRVAQANVSFGGMREGWETDRGEVYIRFGPPDEVERHPFEVDSRPYEVWYYYDNSRRFIFVDELGYGEYRLVSNLWQ